MPSTSNVSKQTFETLVRRVEILEATIRNMTLESLKDVTTAGATDNAVLGFDATTKEWSAMNEE